MPARREVSASPFPGTVEGDLKIAVAEKEKLDQELMSFEAHALKGNPSSKHHVLRVVSTANEL